MKKNEKLGNIRSLRKWHSAAMNASGKRPSGNWLDGFGRRGTQREVRNEKAAVLRTPGGLDSDRGP